jgi:hypothetical protein
MSSRRGITGVAVVGITLLALCLAGLVANFLTGIALNIDGLLLLAVCLMMAAVLAGVMLSLAKQWGWIGKHAKQSAAEPAAAGPAAARAPVEKPAVEKTPAAQAK